MKYFIKHSGVSEGRRPHVSLHGLLTDTTDWWLCMLAALFWSWKFKIKVLMRLLSPEASVLGL